MKTTITLVRHGTTLWMEEGRIHGKLDAPLSENGKGIVEERSKLLLGRQYDCFYCSPTGRAVQTAEIIGKTIQMQPVILDGLEELDFGVFEGEIKERVAEKIDSKKGKLLGWVKPFGKGGETLFHLFLRCKKALNRIFKAHPGESILIASHGIFINMAVRIITGKYFMYFDLQPVGMVTLTVNRFGFGRIVSIE